MFGEKGLVSVITGNGKGKTTSALGQAVRASGQGARVVIIQFMKGWDGYGELKSIQKLDGVTLFHTGGTRCIRKGEEAENDFAEAEKGMSLAKKYLAPGMCDMLILDEINVALDWGLVKLDNAIALIKNKPEDVELILTGRYANEKIIEMADLVSEVKEIKHPYQKGITARRGVEF